jgi:hypothetical protein
VTMAEQVRSLRQYSKRQYDNPTSTRREEVPMNGEKHAKEGDWARIDLILFNSERK